MKQELVDAVNAIVAALNGGTADRALRLALDLLELVEGMDEK